VTRRAGRPTARRAPPNEHYSRTRGARPGRLKYLLQVCRLPAVVAGPPRTDISHAPVRNKSTRGRHPNDGFSRRTSTVLGDRPAQVDAARGEPRPEGRQHEAVALCEAPLLVPLGKGNGNCPAHGISVAIEIDDDAVEAEASASRASCRPWCPSSATTPWRSVTARPIRTTGTARRATRRSHVAPESPVSPGSSFTRRNSVAWRMPALSHTRRRGDPYSDSMIRCYARGGVSSKLRSWSMRRPCGVLKSGT